MQKVHERLNVDCLSIGRERITTVAVAVTDSAVASMNEQFTALILADGASGGYCLRLGFVN